MDPKNQKILLIVIVIIVALVSVLAILGPMLLEALHIIPSSHQMGANVLVLGTPSVDVITTLSGREAVMKGISYPINLDPSYITLDTLKIYNVVILQGDPYFDMNTREMVNQYVQGGGKLIIVGDAGSKHPMYPNVAGWSWPSGQGIPVPAEIIGEWAGWSDISYGSTLRWADQNHPIVKGLKLTGSTTTTPTQVFKVTAQGKAIAAIDTDEGTLPAIIEGGSGLGNVIYFAYDPGQTPEILLTTVGYLAGI